MADAPAHAKVFVRTTEDGELHGGKLELRIYISDGLVVVTPTEHAITAATAKADPSIGAQVDSFYTTLKQVFDLERDTVELVALPSDFASITDLEAVRAPDVVEASRRARQGHGATTRCG